MRKAREEEGLRPLALCLAPGCGRPLAQQPRQRESTVTSLSCGHLVHSGAPIHAHVRIIRPCACGSVSEAIFLSPLETSRAAECLASVLEAHIESVCAPKGPGGPFARPRDMSLPPCPMCRERMKHSDITTLDPQEIFGRVMMRMISRGSAREDGEGGGEERHGE